MPRVKKRRKPIDAHWFYTRPGQTTIFGRDREGRCDYYRQDGGGTYVAYPAIEKLAPLHGRVSFSNSVRFSARVRSRHALEIAFNRAPAADLLTSGLVDLPDHRSHARRASRQGMDDAMIALTGATRSATGYTDWYRNNHGGQVDPVNWEWCHLLAHSMGGADGPSNIVACVKGNNSEQLAIESALMAYRRENAFRMEISALRLKTAGPERYIGDVIRYRILCGATASEHIRYLDCLNAPNPSAIHYYDVLHDVVLWANRQLGRIGHVAPGTAQNIRQMIRNSSPGYRPY